ncbi:hypothetical protein FBY51_1561 [Zymomonas mobilis]|uniref:hypothetical protein n=1 Tax=Zymomonas mobilis TaxID=542 RepID=UPI00026D89CA|nr:hypothetical protein [Zymomonas mobilis]AFN57385.1 hypothetical protein ZZ6_1523 [Zymomonas mobilis subsp. mobilis ATCC 29191]TQK78853.1 hypothetical protein FBY53_1554 [Zymomonas mobilis]TQL14712.1 hypothetical protein FBY51_1561 [Zymomonas mobilis]GEB88248.1 hypothetical protein ZMO01_15880 [Zymomonas mobilis subsp. mobilis]
MSCHGSYAAACYERRSDLMGKNLFWAGIGLLALALPVAVMAYPRGYHYGHYGRSGYIRNGYSSGYVRGYDHSGYIRHYGWSGYVPRYGSMGYNHRYNPYNHNPMRYNHSYNHLDRQLLYPSNRWDGAYRYNGYER